MANNSDILKQIQDESDAIRSRVDSDRLNTRSEMQAFSGMLSQGLNRSNTSVTLPQFTSSPFYKTPEPPAQQQSGGGGGGSVICTKLNQLHLCDKEIYRSVTKFGVLLSINSPLTMDGYYLWGVPIAERLEHNTILLKLTYPVFSAIALEIASRDGIERKRSFLTKALGKVALNSLMHFSKVLGCLSKFQSSYAI